MIFQISLLDRSDFKSYERDPPLTEVGKIGSLELGYSLGVAGISPSKIGGVVYCSPTCAAIESANFICKGLALAAAGNQTPTDEYKIRIENGLVMQLGQDSRVNARNLPKWLSVDEIQNGLGRQVDTTYRSAVPDFATESVDECYAR